jgi:hypothetical protein
MRRRLIIGERIMYVDAETPLNCVFAVKIRSTILLENLRVALTKIQQKHPLLRTRIKEDSAGVPWKYFEYFCGFFCSLPNGGSPCPECSFHV